MRSADGAILSEFLAYALHGYKRPIYGHRMKVLPKSTLELPPVAKAHPFLRWAGSKRQLLPKLQPLIEASPGRYIEPFMGSAALFFSLSSRKGILSDLNGELVDTFLTVRSSPRAVADALAKYVNSEAAFYVVRATEPEKLDKIGRAARFIYLNRFCFNGLYRTNSKGHFNVPYGRPKNDNRPTADQLAACARHLKAARIRTGDFESVLRSEVKRGDIVYLDPPFALEKRRVFSEYFKTSFKIADLDRLSDTLDMINKRGATFVMSYAYCSEAIDHFSKWHTRRVHVQRNISGFASERRKSQELVVSNVPLAALL